MVVLILVSSLVKTREVLLFHFDTRRCYENKNIYLHKHVTNVQSYTKTVRV